MEEVTEALGVSSKSVDRSRPANIMNAVVLIHPTEGSKSLLETNRVNNNKEMCILVVDRVVISF